jgi:hypothetical protein
MSAQFHIVTFNHSQWNPVKALKCARSSLAMWMTTRPMLFNSRKSESSRFYFAVQRFAQVYSAARTRNARIALPSESWNSRHVADISQCGWFACRHTHCRDCSIFFSSAIDLNGEQVDGGSAKGIPGSGRQALPEAATLNFGGRSSPPGFGTYGGTIRSAHSTAATDRCFGSTHFPSPGSGKL